MQTKTVWVNSRYWRCTRQLCSPLFSVEQEYCNLSNCQTVCGGRPKIINQLPKCCYSKCDKITRETSKYCSDACRKNYARARYVSKKKGALLKAYN